MSARGVIKYISVPKAARRAGVDAHGARVETAFTPDESPRRDDIPLRRALFHRGPHRPTRELLDGSMFVDGLVRVGGSSKSGGQDIRVYPPPLPGERDEETRRRGNVPFISGGKELEGAALLVESHQIAAEEAVEAYLRGVGKERER